MVLSSRVLVFSDTYVKTGSEASLLRFRVEKNEHEILLEAATNDRSTIYSKVITRDDPTISGFITSFEVLGTILSDAVAKTKKHVILSYMINENRDIDLTITVDTDYFKCSLDYVLTRIKAPFDAETEINNLREEMMSLLS